MSKDGTPPAAPKAPEKYALVVPDHGKDVFAAEDLAFLETIARQNDWTNEEAQAELTAAADRAQARTQTRAAEFLAATTADKDYGGDKLLETDTLARSVINRIRPEGHPRRQAFLGLIEAGGFHHHIEVVSFLADLGKLMAEDGAVGGTTAGGSDNRSAAEVLYGSPAT